MLDVGAKLLESREGRPFRRDILLSMALAQCGLASAAFDDQAVAAGCELYFIYSSPILPLLPPPLQILRLLFAAECSTLHPSHEILQEYYASALIDVNYTLFILPQKLHQVLSNGILRNPVGH